MAIKKLALFVEGQTEQIFLQRLIEEIAGSKRIQFDVQAVQKGGTLGLVKLTQKLIPNQQNQPNYFVLIVDCRGDERVKSTLLDRRQTLLKSGYSLILGLRDLYPNSLADLVRIKSKLPYMIPTADVPTYMLLAVSEIEAWFLQDANHFPKMQPKLDPSTFGVKFGFDPSVDSAETVPCAAEMLDKIYSSVGLRYKKSRNHVQRTVDVLDYPDLYLSLTDRLPHLDEFINHINAFLG